MSRALDGTNPVAYLGVRPLTPPNMILPGIKPTSIPRDPTENDYQYNLGDFWLNTTTEGLWYLAALGSHLVSGVNTRFATWILIGTGSGTVKTLTGNTGGHVGPDVNGNINTLGDVVSGIVVNGNPGTNTLTWTSSGGGHFGETLTGDTGGAVQFDSSGNINTITNHASVNAGSSVLIAGNPGTHTLTLNVTDASNNTLVGNLAGNLTLTGTNNTSVGKNSLHALTTGAFNTAVGSGLSLGGLTTGQFNTAVGYQTLDEITTGNGNTAIGTTAGSLLTVNDSNNVLINYAGIAGSNFQWFFSFGSGGDLFTHNYGTENTFLGDLSGNVTLTTGSAIQNTAVGYNTLGDLTTGGRNVAVGWNSLSNNTTGSVNVAVGTDCLNACTTGFQNVSVGNSLARLTTGSLNTSVGYFAGDGLITGTNNTYIGQSAGFSAGAADSSNVYINHQGIGGENNVMRLGTDGSLTGEINLTYMSGDVHMPHNLYLDASTTSAATNPRIIFGASNNNISFLVNNVFLGMNAGNTTLNPGVALFNIGIGPNSSNSITTGDRNVGVGNGTNQVLTTGSANCSYGYVSLNSLTTGVSNTCYGDSSGEDLVTGSRNVLIGQGAGQDYNGAESDNIIIGQNIPGTPGTNNTLIIGAGTGTGSGQVNRAFISGIRGITTGVADAIAVLIDSAGQLGTVSSSIRFKDNVRDMGPKSDPIMGLRPVTFHYKKDETKSQQFGLIAEEVSQVFPKLVVYDKDGNAETVKYHELPVLLLNELQKQKKTIDALSLTVRHLENILQDKSCRC